MVKNPFIGQLDRKISIVRLLPQRTVTGNVSDSDETVSEPWAKLDSDSGSEDFLGKEMHQATRGYVIRYDRTVEEFGKDFVLIDQNQRFKITHIEPIGRRRHLLLKVQIHE